MDQQQTVFLILSLIELCEMDDQEIEDDMTLLQCFGQWAYQNWYKEKRYHIPRFENFVEEVIPEMTGQEFRSHFRMKLSTFRIILRKIEPELKRQIPGCPMISPQKQLCIAIWRMANQESYRTICLKFSVSYATAWSSVRRVIKVLAALSGKIIVWPEGDQIRKNAEEFEAASGFPNVIGAIDGTHINIVAPKKDHEAYIDRKGHHSIHLQAVCAANNQFIHCFAGHVGSVHDQQVFRLSDVQNFLGDPVKFPDGHHLLGDSAYKMHENLLTPYRNNGHLTDRQLNYNLCHSSARITIGRAFGLLKQRFRSLLNVLNMSRVDLIPEYIMACCVLHNICLMNDDELDENLGVLNRIDDEEEGYDNFIDHQDPNERRLVAAATAKRDNISNQLPLRYM